MWNGDVVDETIESWTEAQRRLWEVWSRAGQNVSRPGSGHGTGHCLDPLEALAEQMLAAQHASLQTWTSSLQAMPGLPGAYRSWMRQATDPMDKWTSLQQHLLHAWFALGRQLVPCPGDATWQSWQLGLQQLLRAEERPN
jgi:hypothetical protein